MPYRDVTDLKGLETVARAAARMGFTGKTAVHPTQVPVIEQAFSPGPEETERAKKIIAAYEANRAGVLLVDGKLIERPVMLTAPRPRRMWASGSLRFHGPLRIGTAATRRSRVAAVEEKDGRSGKLVFVTVHHAITDPARLVVEEEQQLVYREAPKAGTPTRADD